MHGMKAAPQENKRTPRYWYIQFNISQTGFLGGIWSCGLPPASGTTKLIFLSLEILPSSARDVKIIRIFVHSPRYRPIELMRKIGNRALRSGDYEGCLFLRQCRMWKRFLHWKKKRTSFNWQQETVLFSYSDIVPYGYRRVFTRISKISDSWKLHTIVCPSEVELSWWSLNVNSDV